MFLPARPAATATGNYSERTAREIDVEVRKIIDDATREVRDVLKARRAVLEAVAQRLIEKEVIDGAELRQLMQQYAPTCRRRPWRRAQATTVLEPGDGPGSGEPCIHTG